MKHIITFFLKYWKSLLFAFLILYVSLIRVVPEIPIPLFPHFDKLVHFGLYFGLSALLFYDYSWKNERASSLKKMLIIILLPVLYGGVIEILQETFFPPRSADWFDFIADALGCILAFAMMTGVEKKIIKRA